MANTITIEIPVSLIDNTEPAVSQITEKVAKLGQASKGLMNIGNGRGFLKSASKDASAFVKSVEKAERKAKGFSGTKVQTDITAQDKASAVIETAERKAKGFSGTKAETNLSAKDNASPKVTSLRSKVREFASKRWEAVLGAKDKASGVASAAIGKVRQFKESHWETILGAKDRASGIVSKVTSRVRGFASRTWSATLKVRDMATAPIRGVLNLLKSPLMAAGVTFSLGAALAGSVSTYTGFTSTMSEVSAISGATGQELDGLTQKAKDLGAATKFTATEVGEGMKYMGMAGWSAGQTMSGISGVLNLAAASGEDLARTSDIVTDGLSAFNMAADQSTHFADVLAVASSAANTNVGMMGETFKYAGTAAGSLHYSIEDTAMAIGLMANRGIKASSAGTMLNSMYTRLATNTNGARDAIESLGVSFYDGQGNARSFRSIMEGLREATANMTDEQKANFSNTVAGLRAQNGLKAILNATDEEYRKLATSIDNADGASQRMSDTMLDNLGGRWTLFQSALDGVKNTLGERMSPYLTDFIERATALMPDFEIAVSHSMDAVDKFIDGTKEKIAGFTSSAEWQDADLFGKMHIAWDELIADPFKEWWGSKGKAMFADVAGDIGHGIGAGISMGILGLLGITLSDGVNEGVSVGASFAKGFASGFDLSAVSGSLMGTAKDVIGGIFSSASSLVPGGQTAGISSWISALLIGNLGFKALGGIFKGFDIAKKLAPILGSTGNQMMQGTGLLNVLSNTGYAMTGGASTAGGYFGAGTAMSGGAAAALGTAGIAGGIIAAGGLLSSIADTNRAASSTDEDEQRAYHTSAGLKAGGLATGAVTGAAIGSAFFGIGAVPGALIGAGIGTLAGTFGGNKVTNNYEESKRKAEEAAAAADLLAEKSKYALEGSSFGNDKLAEAFKDTGVSATQFGQMMQEAVNEDMQERFGSISMALAEIQAAAKAIVFDGDGSGFMKFSQAASDAENSISRLQDSVSSMDKLNWKASLGMINDESSAEEYKKGISDMISNAQSVLENEHYQATAAIDLLVEPGNPVDMTSGLNAMYSNLNQELSSASDELHAQLDIVLEDGKIDADEQKILADYQQKVTEITDKIASAKSEAGMQALQIKYSGAQLDYNSFQNLTAELQAQAQETLNGYDEALEVGLTNLNLQFESGAINQAQYDAQFGALTEGYQANVQDLAVNVESFQLDSIAQSFGSQLDNIAPDIEGTTAEKLGTVLNNALAAGVDVEGWDVQEASRWFNFEGMTGVAQSELTQMMSTVAATIPDEMKNAMAGTGDAASGLGAAMQDSFNAMDMSGIGPTLMGKIDESMSGMDMSSQGGGLMDGLQENLKGQLESMDFSDASSTMMSKAGEEMQSADFSESASGMASGMQAAVDGAASEVDTAGFADTVSSNISTSVEGMDYSPVGSAVGTGVGTAILGSLPTIQTAISSLYSQVGSAINSAFSAGFSTTTTVTITANYKLANPTATISFSGGGSGSATVHGSISSHAEGGILNGPELSWVAEDGPEAIIPLGSKRRSRGIDLWMQAGEKLGIMKNAEGGIYGTNVSNNYGNSNKYFDQTVTNTADSESSGVSDYSLSLNSDSEKSAPGIQISISLAPNFSIGNVDENSVVSIIKSKMKEIADDLSGEIAIRLEEAYENTPII